MWEAADVREDEHPIKLFDSYPTCPECFTNQEKARQPSTAFYNLY